MCCGDEHKNDPAYAKSRCSAGILLCNEITYCVLIIAISFVSVAIALLLCVLAADGSTDTETSFNASRRLVVRNGDTLSNII